MQIGMGRTTGQSGGSRLLACAIAMAVLSAIGAQPVLAETFTIDPAQSEAVVSGTATMDVPNGAVVIPGVSQGTGAVLPSGGQSDGLTTFFEGDIEVDHTPSTIQFKITGTRVDVGDSGSWIPGVPGATAMAAPANAAVSLDDATLGVAANVALRDLRFAITSFALPLTETGVGTNVFEFDADVFLRLTGGSRDLEINFSASIPRLVLRGPLMPIATGVGTLELPPGGQPRLTLPIAATDIELGRDVLQTAVTMSLAGQIVATVPEPSGLYAGLTALLVLAALRGARSQP